jgi:protein lifeguard
MFLCFSVPVSCQHALGASANKVSHESWIAIAQVSNPSAVLMAAAITFVIVAGLTAYATQSKYDFTTAGGVLTGALLALLLVSIIGIFFHAKVFELLIAGGGAVLFSCFLVVDIQMMMDGKSIQLSPDDFVLASLSIYLDIVNLFLYILRIINASRD